MPPSTTRRQLNQHSQNIPLTARLHSISTDALFVREQAKAWGLPVVANERCGSWYVPPDIKTASVYFKSTDGHRGEWAFNLRRLNLHLLPIIGSNGGCIIVDSCRRGKHMSDALSKTVPIWCAVLNSLLFPECPEHHRLVVDDQFVLEDEALEISERLTQFSAFAESLQLDLSTLRQSLKKPMLPAWLLPDSSSYSPHHLQDRCNILHLCRASKVQNGTTAATEPDYVQGAGDDAETWSRGLTPQMLWSCTETLLACSEADLPGLIDCVVKAHHSCTTSTDFIQVTGYPQIHLSGLDLAPSPETFTDFTAVIMCAPSCPQELLEANAKKLIFLKCNQGKPGARDLRSQLKQIPIRLPHMRINRLLICCQTGQDLALGVALALVCRYGDESGGISDRPNKVVIDKPFVKRKLALITSSFPTASISRSTLNVIHEHLMPRPDIANKTHGATKKAAIPQKRKADAEMLNQKPDP